MIKTLLLVLAGVVLGVIFCVALALGGWLWTRGWDSAAPAIGMMGPGHMGGMMGPGHMGGMMGNVPPQSSAPDDNRPVDATVAVTAQNMRYIPARVTVKAGQAVRFVVENRDAYAHNFVSPQAGIGEHVIAGGTRATVVWTAPERRSVFRIVCTYHPGMTLLVDVQ